MKNQEGNSPSLFRTPEPYQQTSLDCERRCCFVQKSLMPRPTANAIAPPPPWPRTNLPFQLDDLSSAKKRKLCFPELPSPVTKHNQKARGQMDSSTLFFVDCPPAWCRPNNLHLPELPDYDDEDDHEGGDEPQGAGLSKKKKTSTALRPSLKPRNKTARHHSSIVTTYIRC